MPPCTPGLVLLRFVQNEVQIIGESIRLLSEILEFCKQENIEAYLITAYLEKAFGSIDPTFLICCLEKHGFGNILLTWSNLY